MLLYVFLYFPMGASIQFAPTMLQSIMKRSANRMLLSYVTKLLEPRPSSIMPLSKMPVKRLFMHILRSYATTNINLTATYNNICVCVRAHHCKILCGRACVCVRTTAKYRVCSHTTAKYRVSSCSLQRRFIIFKPKKRKQNKQSAV